MYKNIERFERPKKHAAKTNGPNALNATIKQRDDLAAKLSDAQEKIETLEAQIKNLSKPKKAKKEAKASKKSDEKEVENKD